MPFEVRHYSANSNSSSLVCRNHLLHFVGNFGCQHRLTENRGMHTVIGELRGTLPCTEILTKTQQVDQVDSRITSSVSSANSGGHFIGMHAERRYDAEHPRLRACFPKLFEKSDIA